MSWLTGWKSIANHLDIYWKTAKAWHKKYGMPVLRTPEGKPTQQSEVLDEWIIKLNKEIENYKKNAP